MHSSSWSSCKVKPSAIGHALNCQTEFLKGESENNCNNLYLLIMNDGVKNVSSRFAGWWTYFQLLQFLLTWNSDWKTNSFTALYIWSSFHFGLELCKNLLRFFKVSLNFSQSYHVKGSYFFCFFNLFLVIL